MTDKPHGQWVVLHALKHLPPFGQTAEDIAAVTELSTSGIRTRLKELEDMGLIAVLETKPHRSYMLQKHGWLVANAGESGQMILRTLRTSHAALEGQRAAELAPIKERWDRTIRNQMRMIVLGSLR